MQAAFPIVVFGTVGLSVVMSIVFLLSKGSMYDEIGSGGFPSDGEHAGGARPSRTAAAPNTTRSP